MEVVNLQGVFYEDGGRLMVADEYEGVQDVVLAMGAFGDQMPVHVLAHHYPPIPPDSERWGGGSCHLENTGNCHVGHREHPRWIYSFNASGVFQGGNWIVVSPDGATHSLLWRNLIGHRSQIIVVSIPDFDQIARELADLNPDNMTDIKKSRLEDLQERATEIRDYLEEINRLKNLL
jgi:hypothetical protein